MKGKRKLECVVMGWFVMGSGKAKERKGRRRINKNDGGMKGDGNEGRGGMLKVLSKWGVMIGRRSTRVASWYRHVAIFDRNRMTYLTWPTLFLCFSAWDLSTNFPPLNSFLFYIFLSFSLLFYF